jgi:hypothetical protein
MKTYVHVWQYLAYFYVEWLMFQTKVVEKIKTHLLYSITFLRKSCRLWDNVEKYCRARQATDDNIIGRVPIVSWKTEATDTQSEYVILISFPRQQWLRERVSVLRYTYSACLVLVVLSVMSTAIRLQARLPGKRDYISVSSKYFSFLCSFRPILRPNHPSVQRLTWVLSPRVRR